MKFNDWRGHHTGLGFKTTSKHSLGMQYLAPHINFIPHHLLHIMDCKECMCNHTLHQRGTIPTICGCVGSILTFLKSDVINLVQIDELRWDCEYHKWCVCMVWTGFLPLKQKNITWAYKCFHKTWIADQNQLWDVKVWLVSNVSSSQQTHWLFIFWPACWYA